MEVKHATHRNKKACRILHAQLRTCVRDNEQNIMTLYMDTVKYATPVEMQNPLKS
jgi:hypothetical protein